MDADPTTDQTSDRERLQRARERVAAIKGFYIHLAISLAVIVLLFVVDFATGGGWWVQWVVLGWGIGVLAHALIVFGSSPKFVSRWEERKIREYMDER